jgi:hypothetical protein
MQVVGVCPRNACVRCNQKSSSRSLKHAAVVSRGCWVHQPLWARQAVLGCHFTASNHILLYRRLCVVHSVQYRVIVDLIYHRLASYRSQTVMYVVAPFFESGDAATARATA